LLLILVLELLNIVYGKFGQTREIYAISKTLLSLANALDDHFFLLRAHISHCHHIQLYMVVYYIQVVIHLAL